MWRISTLGLLAACSGTSKDGSGADPTPSDTDPIPDPTTTADTDTTDTTDTDTTDTGATTPAARCVYGGPDAPSVLEYAPTIEDFEGYEVRYNIPPAPKAIVIYFMGGVDASEVNSPEQTAFLTLMGHEDIGYIATDRTDTGGRWDNSTESVTANDDVARLDRLRDAYVASTGWDEDTPVVSMGFSDGASFAVFFAEKAQNELGWPILALLSHSAGSGFNVALPDVPSVFCTAEHDQDNLENVAADLADQQAARGFRSELYVAPERPVTVATLARIDSWDAVQAQEGIDDLVAAGLIDANGDRLVSDATMETAIDDWSDATLLPGFGFLDTRLHVLWALHRYNAYNAAEECDVVMDALGL
jgi:hypothetical protein